jgi:ferredoxin-NADP reductase
VFGSIAYEGEGVFIAGGAGVTPFISILRYLRSRNLTGGNVLIFANKTRGDIIHESEFRNMLGENFINVLSDENVEGYEHGYINAHLLRKYVSSPLQKVYLCGPEAMMYAMERELSEIGISEQAIIKERF